MKKDANRLMIFDTSLRDGEQAPGFNMNLPEKLKLAQALADLGVDIIEAGFPAASEGDFASVQAVARQIKGPIICGLARCTKNDIAKTAEALADAEKKRIHVFLATSAIHREHKLKMAKAEIIKRTTEGVQMARKYCEDVEFSAEDAARTEPEFLAQVVQAAIEAGAGTINIPDTVGYAVPGEFGQLFEYLMKNVPGVENVILSVHCHDDLGMAVANSLAAVKAGARQVECTINGIGERAGNCSLEEVVMAIRTRSEFFGVHTGINTQRLCPTSRLLSTITGINVPPNKAIVGDNAFAHEAGIHQHGVLQHSATYEIMRPEDVGLESNKMVLGKHSGRHAFRQHLEDMGYHLEEEALVRIFKEFKLLADKKKDVLDADIDALIIGTSIRDSGPWKIQMLHTNAGTGVISGATVRLVHEDGHSKDEAAVGDGPIDATFKALSRATGISPQLRDFQVHSITVGKDAQGQVSVAVEHKGKPHRGRGFSTDIVEASAQAFLDAINHIERLSTNDSKPCKQLSSSGKTAS